MNDSHSNPPPPGHEHPQGLVEELRHDLEEAVEHVPPRVRWTVRKLVLLGVAILIGLVIVAVASVVLYYMNRTELAAHELTLFLNHTLATRSNVRIEVSDIRGNPFRQVRLVNPRVVFREGGEPLLEASWIDLGYSPLSLLRPGNESVNLVVDSPVVRIGRNADGSLRVPTWRTSGKIGKPRAFGMHLKLRNGTIVMPVKDGRVEGLDIDALLSTGPQTHALVKSLRWRSGPYQTRSLEMAGQISAGDSVRFEIRHLRTADAELSAAGGWLKGSRAKDLHLTVDHLRWPWLARVTGNSAFDVKGDLAAHVNARLDSVSRGEFTTKLTWDGLPFDATGGFTWVAGRLHAEPLDARSPAGTLNGFADWSHAGWGVGGEVHDGRPEQWGPIGIDGWPEGHVGGRFTYSVETRAHVSHGTLVAHILDSELSGWRADSCEVTADLPAHATRTFDVRAERRGGHFTLNGSTTEHGWRGDYRVAGLPLDEWPDGRTSGIHGTLDTGAGTVEATGGGHLLVTGELAGLGTDWLGMHAAHWRLRSVNGTLLPAPDLTTAVDLGDMMFLGVHWDSAGSPVHLGDRTLDLLAARVWAGDTLLDLSGRAGWSPTSWQLDLDRAAAQSHQFHWSAVPPVRFSGDANGTTFRRLEARDGAAGLSVSGRWAAPGGSYDWEGRVHDLDLAHIGLPEAWGLGGRMDGRLQVDGPSGDPRWSFSGSAGAPAFGGHRGDSLALAVSGSQHRVDLGRGQFRIGEGRLEAHGRFADLAAAWPDSLTGTAVSRWLGTARSWDGALDLHGMPIERVTGLFPATQGWSGQVTGKVSVSGSPADPRLELNAALEPLAWRDFSIERIEVAGRYADDVLTVQRLRAARDQLESSAEGEIPMHLSFRDSSRLLDRPMRLVARVQNGDLRLLPRLVPQIGSASGSVTAEMNIGGTALKPDFDGSARVRGASLRLAGRNEVLEDVTASFRMQRSKITLDTLTARQGERGRLTAHGALTLDGFALKAYRIDLAMREFTATEPGLYAVQFDGDFVATDGSVVRGQLLPYVSGKAVVRRGVILIDFANQTEAEQLAASNPPLYWLYKVDLTAASNLRWQPPDGDIEFSADLTAEQTPTELRLYGEMSAVRGTYYFLSNRFVVDHATITYDNVGGVNPSLDAAATTHVVPTGLDKETPHDVTVTITGRAREPSISFESVPSDWDQNEVLRQLTVGRFVSKQGVAQGDPFDNYLTRAINRTLSSEMSRAFKGYVNEWVIDREQGGLFGGQGEVILGVGSQVTRNLMLRYRQRVPGLGRETVTTSTTGTPFERDLEAEYRLNRFFIISSELTQRRSLSGSTATTSSTPDFNINLKARWEY